MTEPAPTLPSGGEPPATGHPAVDDALAAAVSSDDLPLDQQADALAAVHERLHAALDADRDGTV